ncbi:MAG: hypothetical protein JSR92_12850 [Proteobacteria bacterium]|nr:hypothetical protein [Pseudomonadota bacterium]
MGIGYRELRQYRRLPADDQAALAEVAQAGDKEAVLDLAEELIARQNKRNEQLADKLDKRNREYESLAERQTELSEKLDEATARAALLRRITPDKKAQQMLLELQKDMAGARASLRQAMASVEGFQAHLHEHGIADHDEALSALVIEVLNLVLAPLGALDLGGISKPLAHVKHVVG